MTVELLVAIPLVAGFLAFMAILLDDDGDSYDGFD